MADRKLSASTAITGAALDRLNDLIMALDVSDTTDGAGGTNKKILIAEFLGQFKNEFRNNADSFTSILQNLNTAIRTYTFQDRDGTIADTLINRVIGSTANRYHGSSPSVSSQTTGAMTINSLRGHPFQVDFPCTVDKIAIEITVGTSGKLRLGIYNSNSNGLPNNLMVDGGELTITTPTTYTATVNKTLSPGLYWVAYLTDTANVARIYSTGGHSGLGYGPTLGAGVHGGQWISALSYAALPDPFTAGGNQTITLPPIIALRLNP